ncbi:ARM repeat-containing protein [Mycena kentingensis (nom. inval.)]|nr:ARM repeat-containing protein [Mycena kentingensis (nom. inval.)]
MGKQQQKKRAARRHNPVRVPDSHLPKGLASAEETSQKSQAILPIIQKMQGTDPVERKWACVAVSNLIQNDPSTRRLLQGKNVVGALISRLTDGEEEVVVEAMGALRNLCIDGGYDLCAEMYNKSILVPLKTFVPKVEIRTDRVACSFGQLVTTLSQFLQDTKNAAENTQRLVYEFSDNVITVLWCLSETSNKALTAINELKLVPFLMSFLAARDKIPIAPVSAAAQCLYVLTDDNYPAIAEVRADAGYIACLLSILSSDQPTKVTDPADPRPVTLRVLASGTRNLALAEQFPTAKGVLRNILPIPPPSAASAVDIDKDVVLPQLQPVIADLSLLEASASALELVAIQDATPAMESLSLKHTPKSDHRSPSEIELEYLEGRLRTVQLALEILTGLCAVLPDPDPLALDEDDDDDIGSEDEGDVAMDVPMDGSNTKQPTLNLPILVEPLLKLASPTPLSFPPLASPSPHPPTTSVLSAVHIAALECLNNIFLALTSDGGQITDAAAGCAVWDRVWAVLVSVGTEGGPGQERRRNMWEVGVGVLWGVARVCRGQIGPNADHVRTLMALCDDPNSDAVLRVKCIGALECLAQNAEFPDANKLISDYLLSMLPANDAPSAVGTEPMLQAASSLIYIFSDEESSYDVNFRQNGYLGRLVASVEGVRQAVRLIDKRKEADLRRRGEEIRDNLRAFIEYRRRLRL